jgi:hypothetical protein
MDRVYRVEGEWVYCEIRTEGQRKKTEVRLPPEGLFFDSQQVFHIAFLLSRLRLEPGQVVQVGVFHPSTLRVHALQVERRGESEIVWENESRIVQTFDLRLGFQHMLVYLTPEGKLLKQIEQGGLVRVRWQNPG